MTEVVAVRRRCLLALGGCASIGRIDSDVSTYSQWPAERQPATYAFERLPSQQAQPQRQQLLENSARPAIEAAGFRPGDDKTADVTIQLGARIALTDTSPFNDPFWWGGYPYPWGYGFRDRLYWGGGWRYGWGPRFDSMAYDREVALLIRDRHSGQPLYEAHASSAGLSPQLDSALPAMFEAAMKDFPHGDPNPHRVSVQPAR